MIWNAQEQPIRAWSLAATALAALLALPVSALPPPEQDASELVRSGHPVASIPTADRIYAFRPLDYEHVVLTTTAETHYLVTLNRQCVGLRVARHVGVTASNNEIWAGFDALTADGEACAIREIHLVNEPEDGLF
jgi:hypothetical protein